MVRTEFRKGANGQTVFVNSKDDHMTSCSNCKDLVDELYTEEETSIVESDGERRVENSVYCLPCHEKLFKEKYEFNRVQLVQIPGLEDELHIAEVSPLETKNTAYFLSDTQV